MFDVPVFGAIDFVHQSEGLNMRAGYLVLNGFEPVTETLYNAGNLADEDFEAGFGENEFKSQPEEMDKCIAMIAETQSY